MNAILLDTCVWGGVLKELIVLGHDVEWSGNWKQDPGDKAILEYAHSRKKILVTLDKDFGELAILHGILHSGIIRLSGFRACEFAMAEVKNFRVNTGDPWSSLFNCETRGMRERHELAV